MQKPDFTDKTMEAVIEVLSEYHADYMDIRLSRAPEDAERRRRLRDTMDGLREALHRVGFDSDGIDEEIGYV